MIKLTNATSPCTHQKKLGNYYTFFSRVERLWELCSWTVLPDYTAIAHLRLLCSNDCMMVYQQLQPIPLKLSEADTFSPKNFQRSAFENKGIISNNYLNHKFDTAEKFNTFIYIKEQERKTFKTSQWCLRRGKLYVCKALVQDTVTDSHLKLLIFKYFYLAVMPNTNWVA